VCFGFRTHSDVFCGALEINYSTDYPEIDFSNSDDMQSFVKILLTKAKDWSYEKEFRVIAKEGESEEFLTLKNGMLNISRTDLTTVIVGCSTSAENIEAIRRMISEREQPVDLFAAKPAPNRYTLSLQPL
jgi:hypothetical protein